MMQERAAWKESEHDILMAVMNQHMIDLNHAESEIDDYGDHIRLLEEDLARDRKALEMLKNRIYFQVGNVDHLREMKKKQLTEFQELSDNYQRNVEQTMKEEFDIWQKSWSQKALDEAEKDGLATIAGLGTPNMQDKEESNRCKDRTLLEGQRGIQPMQG